MSQLQDPVYHTAIWAEEPEADNPFAARAARCHGYDVYGELLPRAGWFEYVLLLFRGERVSAAEAALLVAWRWPLPIPACAMPLYGRP